MTQRKFVATNVLLICFLLIPFGTALQSLLLAVLLISFLSSWQRQGETTVPSHRSLVKRTSFVFLLWILWSGVATWLNPRNPSQNWPQFAMGYLALALLPLLSAYRPVNKEQVCRKLNHLAPWVLGIWALLATSQSLWGWSLLREIGHASNFRPHGFYSHPLTLAYVALLTFPFALIRWLSQPRSLSHAITLLASTTLLLLTNSRTCMLVAFLFVLWNVWQQLKGRTRLAAILLTTIAVGLVAVTDNPVSQRMAATFAADSPDRFSDYPDDRLAFWHAHALMIAERPITGHGIDLNTAYRTPYYERLGLEDFPRKYSAHNQWLQFIANGGAIGTTLICIWLLMILRQINQAILEDQDKAILRQSLAILLIASLSQNAFYDSEVRYGLALILCILASSAKTRPKDLKS